VPSIGGGIGMVWTEWSTTRISAGNLANETGNVTAFGESCPLVPTADGAREQQNCRVEITLG
jgi:hypothetical protein